MMSKFINRTAELEFLESLYSSNGFQFVPIYLAEKEETLELVVFGEMF